MIRTVSLNGVAAASAAGNGRGDMAAAPDAACSFTDVDVATRISLVDAHTAFIQVKKGKATGNRYALWLRWKLQQRLFKLGCFIQKHDSKVLFVGILLLSLCCVGLKRAYLQTNIERLWIEEGGRLSKELNYTQEWLGEGSGTTYEIIIQVSNDEIPSNQPEKDGSGISSNRNILNAKSLLRHLDAVLAATRLTVDVYDKTWRFNNLCYAASFPNFDDDGFINQILSKLEPCVIISPLDCFWEGSKLLGPDYGVYIPGYGYDIKWSNLNPEDAVSSMPGLGSNFRNQAEELLQMAGITTGYQYKPCLNPEDVDCPPTAPNYRSKQVPDVMAELTGGCQGVSTKYLSWEEDLLVGGATHDSSDQLSSGKALQTLLQLMGEKDLYDYWANTQQTYGLDWTVDKARQVLDTWRRKFTQVVLTSQNSSSPDRVVAMSSLDVADVMDDFSQLNVLRIIVGCLLVCIYACAALVNLSDSVQSQAAVGLAGVFLVILSVAAGLGICSVVGVQFNAASTQILPFLAVSIGMDDVFLVAHTFKLHAVRTDVDYMDQTGECLKRIGVTVVLTSLCNACAFFLAAIIPLPAMRAFCLQSAVVVIFNMISVLVVYPAVISLDLVRRRKNRVDFFVCFTWSGIRSSDPASSSSLSSPTVGSDGRTMGTYSRHDAVRWSQHPASDSAAAGRLARPQQFQNVVAATNADGCYPTSKLAQRSSRDSGFWNVPSQTLPSTVSSASLPELGVCKCCSANTSCTHIKPRLGKWSLTRFVRDFYSPLLQKTAFKVAVIVVGLGLAGASAFGVYLIRDGLDITDIVPRDTTEHQFLDAQSKYFGFYNFYAVTQQHFDYTSTDNQKLLYAYHQSFIKVGNIIKQEDGSLPEFWLQQFRAWLLVIQSSFDKDVASGCISRSGWNSNATVDGRLGYKLMVQTGQPNNPIDRNRVDSGRLVSSSGIIYPPAFYVYLSAWVSNDAMAYTSSQSALRPHPKQWLHDEFDTSLEIPASQPLAYTQLAFYLHNLGSTENITNTIKDIRDICESYVVQGLPNFPQGIIFTFWEQYINLRFYLVFALVAVFSAVFLVLSITLLNPWAAAIVAGVLGVTVVELFGLMGLTGIKLSAIPAVTLVITAGIGVEFTVYITLNFLSAVGSSRDMRVAIALEPSFAPVVHGAISTLLGIIMLAGSQFDFIVRYFFMILTLLVGLGLLNGVVLLPVLLSVAGPRPEVVALNNADLLPAASSQKTAQKKGIQYHRKRSRSRQAAYTRRREELSTIAEESSQHQSSISPTDDLSSISVEVEQPEIVVETVTSSQPQISIQPMVHSAATIPQVPSQPPPPYSGSAPPHLSSANVGGCCMCNPARCQSYQLHTPLPQYQGIPISSTAQFQGIPLTTAAVSSTAPFHSFPAVSETTTSYYGVPMASAATNSSTSTVSSTSSGRHVTTIRTTARVKVEVHTPVPSFSQSPDFKSRRRKRARVDRPITSFGSSTDS